MQHFYKIIGLLIIVILSSCNNAIKTQSNSDIASDTLVPLRDSINIKDVSDVWKSHLLNPVTDSIIDWYMGDTIVSSNFIGAITNKPIKDASHRKFKFFKNKETGKYVCEFIYPDCAVLAELKYYKDGIFLFERGTKYLYADAKKGYLMAFRGMINGQLPESGNNGLCHILDDNLFPVIDIARTLEKPYNVSFINSYSKKETSNNCVYQRSEIVIDSISNHSYFDLKLSNLDKLKRTNAEKTALKDTLSREKFDCKHPIWF
jgi:hypothetical protein